MPSRALVPAFTYRINDFKHLEELKERGGAIALAALQQATFPTGMGTTPRSRARADFGVAGLTFSEQHPMSKNIWRGHVGDFDLGANWSSGEVGGDDEIHSGDAKIGAGETIVDVQSLEIRSPGVLTVNGVLGNVAIVNGGDIRDFGKIGARASALTNTGTLEVGRMPFGLIEGRGGLLRVASLANSGTLDVEGSPPNSAYSALVEIESKAGFGRAGVVTGDVSVSGNAEVDFARGKLTKIATLDSLKLNGANAVISDAAKRGSNSAVDLSVINGELDLDNGASLTSTGSLDVRGPSIGIYYPRVGLDDDRLSAEGGSSLTVEGTLSNASEFFDIGSSHIIADDSVTAGSLDNAGYMSLVGDPGLAEASLTVHSAATNRLGISLEGARALFSGSFDNSGECTLGGSDFTIDGAVTGTGSFQLGSRAAELNTTLECDGAVEAGQTLYFIQQSAGDLTLKLGDPVGFAANIEFGAEYAHVGDEQIDLSGFGTGTTSAFAANVLTLTDGAEIARLTFIGAPYALSSFAITTTASETVIRNTNV